MALTMKRVTRLTQPGRYLDGAGLYLQVLSATNRSWLLRYELRGRKRWMGLGSASVFTLEEARQRARRARQLLADKIDPLEARRAERAQQAAAAARNKTFRDVVAEFYDVHAAGWTNAKHRADFLATLKTHAFPLLGSLPVAAIDEPLVLSVLQPIWTTKTVTAGRVRTRIHAVMDFAAACGYCSGPNPARWGHLRHLLPKPEKIVAVRHMPALPYAELPAFMAELRAVPGIAARALEFTILTAARTGEVLGARWSEIDLVNAVWTVPAARMKAGKEHRVPLSTPAVELLRALPREAEFVFVGAKAGRPIGNVAMYRQLRQLRGDITVHGFRACFRVWAEETTAYPAVVAEQALAHNVGSAVERAYRRTDLFNKRVRLMEQWAALCSRKIFPTDTAVSVTPIRAP